MHNKKGFIDSLLTIAIAAVVGLSLGIVFSYPVSMLCNTPIPFLIGGGIGVIVILIGTYMES